MNKSFPLADVLSITTGRLVCPIERVYEILNHITGDNLFTHALPRACRFAAPFILDTYPTLGLAGSEISLGALDAMLQIAGCDHGRAKKACGAWVELMRERHGLTAEYLIPSNADAWLSRNPIEELQSMTDKPIVAVTP